MSPATDSLSARDFDRIARLIGDTVGIQLPPEKRVTVEGRLRKRVRALGLSNLKAYCDLLASPGGMTAELASLIDVITTNKTDFFRENDHFLLLRERLVPELLGRARGALPHLKLWSAASSTGAEAYTIAMVLADLMGQGRRFDFSVLGTDISTDVLHTAARAIYPVEQLAPTPPPLRRFLMTARSERMHGKVRIAPELRERVRFRRLNLMDPRYPMEDDFDVIFLRNVLIYFSRTDQAAVIRRVLSHLKPGGFLLLGHAESMVPGMNAATVAPAVFQKDSDR